MAFLLTLAACATPPAAEPGATALFGDADINAAVLELAETAEVFTAAKMDMAPEGVEGRLPDAADEASSPTLLPGADGYMAYVRYAPESVAPWQLYLNDQSSGVQTRVYGGRREVQSVAVSLDGDTLVFAMRETTEPTGSYQVYRLQVSSGSVSRLTRTPSHESNVSISADGRTIAWEGEGPGGRRAVFVRDYSDEAFSEQILVADGDQLQPTVSGDGAYIAMLFVSGNYQVVLYDRAQNSYLGVLSSSRALDHPSVSNGGAKVAWLERPSLEEAGPDPSALRFRIRVKDLEAGSVATAVSRVSPLEYPHLTADGKFLSYGQLQDGSWTVRTRHLSSGQQATAVVAGESAKLFGMYWQKAVATPAPPPQTLTHVSTDGERWLINGEVTHPGTPAEGLLLNSRMVQATFDDANPETVGLWSYPDGSPYDPDRQTDEFIAALPDYAAYGLRAVTLNFQGGGPRARRFTNEQPWENTAFHPDGSLKEAYLERMDRAIRALDENGMVAIVGFFYFGQDHRLEDEAAILRATDNATDWLLSQGYSNVVVEVNNEADLNYDHDILKEERVHELIERVQERSEGRLLVSTSFKGGTIPPDAVLEQSDFILLHGNNRDADRIQAMVDRTRRRLGAPKPIIFNEDSTDLSNLDAAVSKGASWGYYDQGQNNYHDGFQSPPTNWSINTPEKRAFFERVRELTEVGIVETD